MELPETILKEYYINKENYYKIGRVIIIKVKSLYEKTHVKLSGDSTYLNPEKRRPIIVCAKKGEKYSFIATSKYDSDNKERVEFDYEKCRFKTGMECSSLFNTKTKSQTVLFKLKDKNKYHFNINLKIIEELKESGDLSICGDCDENYVTKTYQYISKYKR